MDNQIGLFEHAARQRETSAAARKSVAADLGPLQARLLSFIRDQGARGATDEEAQSALRMNPSTQRPRRIELAGKGLIALSGETRKTKTGRKANVWRAHHV